MDSCKIIRGLQICCIQREVVLIGTMSLLSFEACSYILWHEWRLYKTFQIVGLFSICSFSCKLALNYILQSISSSSYPTSYRSISTTKAYSIWNELVRKFVQSILCFSCFTVGQIVKINYMNLHFWLLHSRLFFLNVLVHSIWVWLLYQMLLNFLLGCVRTQSQLNLYLQWVSWPVVTAYSTWYLSVIQITLDWCKCTILHVLYNRIGLIFPGPLVCNLNQNF